MKLPFKNFCAHLFHLKKDILMKACRSDDHIEEGAVKRAEEMNTFEEKNFAFCLIWR
jgi:hypothetical protein